MLILVSKHQFRTPSATELSPPMADSLYWAEHHYLFHHFYHCNPYLFLKLFVKNNRLFPTIRQYYVTLETIFISLSLSHICTEYTAHEHKLHNKSWMVIICSTFKSNLCIKSIALQHHIINICMYVYAPSIVCWKMWSTVVQTTLHMTHIVSLIIIGNIKHTH